MIPGTQNTNMNNKQTWTPVNHAAPPKSNLSHGFRSVNVLIFANDEITFGFCVYGESWRHDETQHVINNVTHWAYIPEKPEDV